MCFYFTTASLAYSAGMKTHLVIRTLFWTVLGIKLVRLVTGARKYDHVTPLARDHHLRPIAERVECELCTLVLYWSENRSVRSAHALPAVILDVPRTRLSIGHRAFIAAGPRAWNYSPLNVSSAKSMPIFRQLLEHIYSSVSILLIFYSCLL